MTDRAVEAAAIGESFSGDLSIWGLFMQADMVVKLVMLILIVASVWSWAIIFEKRKTLKNFITAPMISKMHSGRANRWISFIIT